MIPTLVFVALFLALIAVFAAKVRLETKETPGRLASQRPTRAARHAAGASGSSWYSGDTGGGFSSGGFGGGDSGGCASDGGGSSGGCD